MPSDAYDIVALKTRLGDIRTEDVAARGGLASEVVREKYRSDRDTATNNQIRGAAAIVDDLVRQGRVHGIIGIGGGTATLVPFDLADMAAISVDGRGQPPRRG